MKRHKDTFSYIQKRQGYMMKEYLEVFKRDYCVESITFVQRVGDVVIIPTCVPHQGVNVNSTIKMAIYLLSPYNAQKCLQNLEIIQSVLKREDYVGAKRALH